MSQHISYLIEVHDDYDASPNDFDCYDDEAKAAFERGEWSYVGVEVHAVREHFEGTVNVQTIASDSLWAVEHMGDEARFVEHVLDVTDVEGVCRGAGVPVPDPSAWKVTSR